MISPTKKALEELRDNAAGVDLVPGGIVTVEPGLVLDILNERRSLREVVRAAALRLSLDGYFPLSDRCNAALALGEDEDLGFPFEGSLP